MVVVGVSVVSCRTAATVLQEGAVLTQHLPWHARSTNKGTSRCWMCCSTSTPQSCALAPTSSRRRWLTRSLPISARSARSISTSSDGSRCGMLLLPLHPTLLASFLSPLTVVTTHPKVWDAPTPTPRRSHCQLPVAHHHSLLSLLKHRSVLLLLPFLLHFTLLTILRSVGASHSHSTPAMYPPSSHSTSGDGCGSDGCGGHAASIWLLSPFFILLSTTFTLLRKTRDSTSKRKCTQANNYHRDHHNRHHCTFSAGSLCVQEALSSKSGRVVSRCFNDTLSDFEKYAVFLNAVQYGMAVVYRLWEDPKTKVCAIDVHEWSFGTLCLKSRPH